MAEKDNTGPTISRLLRGDSLPRIEREILLAEATGRSRGWLYAHGETVPSPEATERFESLVTRRRAGQPIAHLTGRRAFWTLELAVTPDTLIPRPETELLVEFALEQLEPGREWRILDLGTGTGAIALAIAAERPESEVIGVDSEPAAIELARRNGIRCGVRNVRFIVGDWYGPVADRCFDLIVSNPPYVAEGDVHLEQGDVRFEPRSALVSGSDGLDDLKRIIGGAAARLAAGGWLVVEHGHDQQPAVENAFSTAGFASIRSLSDLAGNPRAVAGRIETGNASER